LAFKKTDEGRSCLAETSLQVLLTLFLTLTRVSAKHNKFSIVVSYHFNQLKELCNFLIQV